MCSERRLPTSSTRSHTNRRKFNPFGDALVLSVAFHPRSARTFYPVLLSVSGQFDQGTVLLWPARRPFVEGRGWKRLV